LIAPGQVVDFGSRTLLQHWGMNRYGATLSRMSI
jgi:hypothetical protein